MSSFGETVFDNLPDLMAQCPVHTRHQLRRVSPEEIWLTLELV
jgi:hypothetical protein